MGSVNTTSDVGVRLLEPPLLTMQQAADMLGVSRRWVEQAVADNRIPTVRIGPQSPRIRRASLDEWLGPWRPVVTEVPAPKRRRVTSNDPYGRLEEDS